MRNTENIGLSVKPLQTMSQVAVLQSRSQYSYQEPGKKEQLMFKNLVP